MKTFFFEDENGQFFSANGKRRFIKLNGNEARILLKEDRERGIRHRFLKFIIELPANDEGDRITEDSPDPIIEIVFIEVPKGSEKSHRTEERREQYISQCEKESGMETVSLYAPLKEYEDLTLEETIALPEISVEDNVLHEIELEMLRRALKTLSDDELIIIHELYLAEKTLTERELSEKIGIPQRTINHRKQSILKKLKKFLK